MRSLVGYFRWGEREGSSGWMAFCVELVDRRMLNVGYSRKAV